MPELKKARVLLPQHPVPMLLSVTRSSRAWFVQTLYKLLYEDFFLLLGRRIAMLYQHLSAGWRTLLGAITGDAKPSHGDRDGLAVSSIRGPPRQAAMSCSLSSKPQTGKEPVSTALHATFNLSSLFCCMNNEINEGFLHIMQSDTLQSKKDWTQYSPFCSLEIQMSFSDIQLFSWNVSWSLRLLPPQQT